MYCPKCTKEIQHTSDLTCPYCATTLVDRPPLSDNTPADNSDNQLHAVFEADEMLHDGTLPADSTSMQPASQENVFFLADEVDNAADKKIDHDDPRRITSASQDFSEQGMTLDAVFRQILDAKTAASEDIPAEPAGGSHVSNAASGTHQDHSRELLDKAFEEINTDDRRATASGTKSLAITMLLGTLVLVCVIGAGIYYLKHTPARETAMQMPVKVLSLPASDAPAPTLKSSGATEQKSPGVTARATQDGVEAPQEPAEPPTPVQGAVRHTPEGSSVQNMQGGAAEPTQSSAAGMPQKSAALSGELASINATPQAPPAQMHAQQQQINDGVSGGVDTIQSSTTSSSIHNVANSGTGSHMLLCGSFQNKDKALNLAEKIKSKGYPAFVEKADLESKGVWYRIKIAGISKDAAEKTRDELKIKLKIDAIIAQRK